MLEHELTEPRVERRIQRRFGKGAELRLDFQEPVEGGVASRREARGVLRDRKAREGFLVHDQVFEVHEPRGAKALDRVAIASALERDDPGVHERAVGITLRQERRRDEQSGRHRARGEAPPSARGCTRRPYC